MLNIALGFEQQIFAGMFVHLTVGCAQCACEAKEMVTEVLGVGWVRKRRRERIMFGGDAKKRIFA